MKKFLILAFTFLGLCGFESLSDNLHDFDVENKTPDTWEVEIKNMVVKAFNETYQLELSFNVASFLPNSPQCLSNKRIKDIKFDIDVYKRVQKGDSGFAKMIERMRLYFTGSGVAEEKRIYGSNLLKKDSFAQEGSIIHVGTLQFLAPLTCKKVDKMTLKATGIVVRGRPLPPLEMVFKLNK